MRQPSSASCGWVTNRSSHESVGNVVVRLVSGEPVVVLSLKSLPDEPEKLLACFARTPHAFVPAAPCRRGEEEDDGFSVLLVPGAIARLRS